MKRMKVGMEVVWDCLGDAKKRKDLTLIAPCWIVAINGEQVDIEGPSMVGPGVWNRTVHRNELWKKG
jgi:hypothetical protein